MYTRRDILKGLVAFTGFAATASGSSVVQKSKQNLHPARFWHTMGNVVACDLCPHGCILPNKKTGVCRGRQNIDGTMVTHGYAKPCAIHTDPIEKKPVYHMLPGSLSFSIGVAGCNLRCKNCQNYSMSQRSPLETRNTWLPPADVVDNALKRNCKSIAYTYSEPVVWIEYVLDTAILARKAGLKNILVSSGFINPAPFAELCRVIDAAHIDLKSFDDKVYQNLNAGKLQPVLTTLLNAKKTGMWVEIVNLIVPQWSDDLTMIRKMCRWICSNLGSDTPVHFSRFFPLYQLAHLSPTPVTTLENARAIAHEENLRFVYIGNVPEIDQNTYCPTCNTCLIARSGYTISIESLVDGKCKKCKSVIPGIWNTFS